MGYTLWPGGFSKYMVFLMSSEYWLNILFKLEGRYKFHVDIGCLQQHAVVIDAVFSIPQMGNEGSMDNPIILEQLSASNFAHFNNWFNEAYVSSDFPFYV